MTIIMIIIRISMIIIEIIWTYYGNNDVFFKNIITIRIIWKEYENYNENYNNSKNKMKNI